jgi:hypothetical protein
VIPSGDTPEIGAGRGGDCGWLFLFVLPRTASAQHKSTNSTHWVCVPCADHIITMDTSKVRFYRITCPQQPVPTSRYFRPQSRLVVVVKVTSKPHKHAVSYFMQLRKSFCSCRLVWPRSVTDDNLTLLGIVDGSWRIRKDLHAVYYFCKFCWCVQFLTKMSHSISPPTIYLRAHPLLCCYLP